MSIWHVLDDLQIFLRPRTALAVVVKFLQLRDDLIQFAIAEFSVFAERDSRIFAFEVDANSVDRIVAIVEMFEKDLLQMRNPRRVRRDR
jgi:hypothetical protein